MHTGRRLVTDVSALVAAIVADQGDGLVNCVVPHATAGLCLMEIGSGSEDDLAVMLEQLAPRTTPWRHRHGTPGHGRDHVIPAVVAPSVVLPVIDGRLLLGTWQSLVIVDSNVDNPERRLVVAMLADGKSRGASAPEERSDAGERPGRDVP